MYNYKKKCYTNVTPKKMFSEILGNVRKRSRMLVETLPMNHLLAQLQIVAEIHSIEDGTCNIKKFLMDYKGNYKEGV